MPRPSRREERRRTLIHEIARTFSERGYARTTTAELARRCGVQENILYRLWPDKRTMFTACIDYVYDLSRAIWQELLRDVPAGISPAQHLLRHEARHYGMLGFHRIVFAGLSETEDPEIRRHLRMMYGRFQGFVAELIRAHRAGCRECEPDADTAAWAVIGLGTMANIGQEFGLLSRAARARLIGDAGTLLLDGASQTPTPRTGGKRRH